MHARHGRPRRGIARFSPRNSLGWGPFIVAALMFLIVAAQACADIEPNNTLANAEGPLAAGASYSGSVAPVEDSSDTYLFYVSGQGNFDIQMVDQASLSKTGCYPYLAAGLADANGRHLIPSSDEIPTIGSGTAILPGKELRLAWTSRPGVHAYYFLVDSDFSECGATPYQFSVTASAGASIVAGPPMPRVMTVASENLTPHQAVGPLTAGIGYEQTFPMSGERQWYWFVAAPGTHTLDIMTTVLAAPLVQQGECESQLYPNAINTGPTLLNVLNGRRASLAFGRFVRGQWSHIRLTSRKASRYYLAVSATSSCAGEQYEIVIRPSGMLQRIRAHHKM